MRKYRSQGRGPVLIGRSAATLRDFSEAHENRESGPAGVSRQGGGPSAGGHAAPDLRSRLLAHWMMLSLLLVVVCST